MVFGECAARAQADVSKYVGEDAAEAYAAYSLPVADRSKQFGGACFLDVSDDISVPTAAEQAACMPSPGAQKSAIIWGDSTIAMYAASLRLQFSRAGYSMGQLTSSGCPPIANFHVPSRPFCEAYNDRFIKLIKEAKPTIVVLGGVRDVPPDLLIATLDLIASSTKKIVILGPGPFFHVAPKLILAERARSGDPSVKSDATENPAFKIAELNESTIRKVIAGRTPSVNFISVLGTICPNETCTLAIDGNLLYADELHVSPLGSTISIAKLFPLILR